MWGIGDGSKTRCEFDWDGSSSKRCSIRVLQREVADSVSYSIVWSVVCLEAGIDVLSMWCHDHSLQFWAYSEYALVRSLSGVLCDHRRDFRLWLKPSGLSPLVNVIYPRDIQSEQVKYLEDTWSFRIAITLVSIQSQHISSDHSRWLTRVLFAHCMCSSIRSWLRWVSVKRRYRAGSNWFVFEKEA